MLGDPHDTSRRMASEAIYRIWLADMDNMNRAFRALDAIRTDGDGFMWIDTDETPESLLATYQSLQQVGYAHGWL